MTTSPRSVHVVLLGRPDGRDHRASSLCPCDPVQCRDLEEPGRLVYVHRWGDTRATGEGADAEAMGRYASPCISDQQAPETDRARQSQVLGTGAGQRSSTLGLLGGGWVGVGT
jgi:hypothetical protein